MREPIRVFLADDHRMMRDGIRAILERQPDFEVVGEAADGREAVRLAHQLQPDVVVMDVSMPLLNGLEAMRQILQGCPDTSVLILTVHEREDLVAQLLSAGASGYMIKRAAAQDLVSAVQAVFRGDAYIDPAIAKLVVSGYVSHVQSGSPDSASNNLTDREREVLQLVAEGYTNREIASLLHLSIKTVQNHRAKILRKLDLHDRGELIKYAIEKGIISL
jgi:DNA-binding NarL/FixJ family response regulator